MDKVMVVGSSGSGKSTFSRQLSKILKVPVYHLDMYFLATKLADDAL
ncbi:hypothetical protein Q3408_13155 [Staphylococcus saprophyticus]|nr:hypothetical protein Q3408_13155 [Staphylococcus saprophyticus]